MKTSPIIDKRSKAFGHIAIIGPNGERLEKKYCMVSYNLETKEAVIVKGRKIGLIFLPFKKDGKLQTETIVLKDSHIEFIIPS